MQKLKTLNEKQHFESVLSHLDMEMLKDSINKIYQTEKTLSVFY